MKNVDLFIMFQFFCGENEVQMMLKSSWKMFAALSGAAIQAKWKVVFL